MFACWVGRVDDAIAYAEEAVPLSKAGTDMSLSPSDSSSINQDADNPVVEEQKAERHAALMAQVLFQ